MAKVLIVDDEFWICTLIKKSIDWNALGIDTVLEAHDGIVGFELIKDNEPDIVISDIRMPGKDGLMLIKDAQAAGSKADYIIISGYKDFEYARNAVEFGVKNYLIKPIDEVDLFDTIKKILNTRKSEQRRELHVNDLESAVSQLTEYTKANMLLSLFKGEYSLKNGDEKLNESLDLSRRYFNVVKFQLDHEYKKEARTFLLKAAIEKIKQLTPKILGGFGEVVFVVKEEQLFMLINYDCKQLAPLMKNLQVELCGTPDIIQRFQLTICVGEPVEEIDKIKDSYRAACYASCCRLVCSTKRLIFATDCKYKRVDMKNVFVESMKKEFISIIEVFDIVSLQKWIENIYRYYEKDRQADPKSIFELAQLINMVFCQQLTNMGFEDTEDVSALFLSKLEQMSSLDQIKNELHQYMNKELTRYREEYERRARYPVELAKKYVREHYCENITLKDISNMVYLHPNYFSMLFTKETGICFNDYVIDYRIETAKTLIRDLKNNINTVAKLVGYKDARYFSKLFKRKVGISLSEFRKLYQ